VPAHGRGVLPVFSGTWHGKDFAVFKVDRGWREK
jgi:hypothetical protein